MGSASVSAMPRSRAHVSTIGAGTDVCTGTKGITGTPEVPPAVAILTRPLMFFADGE
jgi:hypothetical protein